MDESENSDFGAGKEGQVSLAGDKNRSINSSPPEVDAVFDMDDGEEEEESDALDTSEPRESASSPAEQCDESAPKRCVYDGCSETSALGAKQRKPWMCKKHRNKMYKDKYKKKKSDQAMASGKLEVSTCFQYKSLTADVFINSKFQLMQLLSKVYCFCSSFILSHHTTEILS